MKELAQSSIDQKSSALEFELLQIIDAFKYFTSTKTTAEKEVSRLM
ncbi:hypothetical protein [Enterococcus sp. AZ196]